MISGACLEEIMNLYPQQVIDVGIAEEHSLVMAAALSFWSHTDCFNLFNLFFKEPTIN